MTGVFARPVCVLGERVGVEGTPDVAAGTGVFVVVPGAADSRRFFEDEEVLARGAFYEVDGCAHACLVPKESERVGWQEMGRSGNTCLIYRLL